MMMVEDRGILASLARPSYHAALLERLKMGPSELRSHPFRERLEALLAEVEHAYASSPNQPTIPAQRRGEGEGLKEQYAPLFWHYLGRALQAADEVELALMEARIRCLLREFQAETGRRLADGPRWYDRQEKGPMHMAKEPRRIAVGPETDLLRVLQEAHADKEPRPSG